MLAWLVASVPGAFMASATSPVPHVPVADGLEPAQRSPTAKLADFTPDNQRLITNYVINGDVD